MGDFYHEQWNNFRARGEATRPEAGASGKGGNHYTDGSSPRLRGGASKDYKKFTELLERPLPGYLQDRTPYNPFKFTLETSRTGASAMAGWATLRLFGFEGYQVMLGRIIEVGIFFRELLQKDKNLVCVNPDNHGFVTLFRVYPKHINGKEQYEKELHNPKYRDELHAYNLLQQRVANKLFEILRNPEQKIPGWENPPCTSVTSGYRSTTYAQDEKDSDNYV